MNLSLTSFINDPLYGQTAVFPVGVFYPIAFYVVIPWVLVPKG